MKTKPVKSPLSVTFHTNKKKSKRKRNKNKSSRSRHGKDNRNLSASKGKMWNQSMQNIQNWHYRHQLALWKSKALSLQYENHMLHEIIRSSNQSNANNTVIESDNSDMESDEMSEEDSSEDSDILTENNEKMEVSEAFMDFLLINAKHKENIRLEKEKKEACDSEKIKIKQMEQPPERSSHVEREKEMKLLYGEASTKISCMEAKCQLDFDSLIDRNKPILWPNIPLKL